MKLYKLFVAIIAFLLLPRFDHVFGSSHILVKNKTAFNMGYLGTESLAWHHDDEMVHIIDTPKAETEMVFDFKNKCIYRSIRTTDSNTAIHKQNNRSHLHATKPQCAAKAATTQTLKTDIDALDYCQAHDNSFIAILWPLAQGKEKKIIDTFNRFGKVHYQKTMMLPESEIFKLVDIAHRDYFSDSVPFLCDNQVDRMKKFIKDHKQKYVPSKEVAQQTSRIFVVEFNDERTATACKKAIRTLFNIGFFSVHVNDTHDETIELAEHLFKRDESITLT